MRKLLIAMAVLVTSLAATLSIAAGSAFAANCNVKTNAPNWTNPGWTLEADLTVYNCTNVEQFQELEQTWMYTPDQVHTTGTHDYTQSGPQVAPPGSGYWAYVLPQRPCHDFSQLGVGGWVWAVTGFRIKNSVGHTWGQESFTQPSPVSQLIPSCVG